jgi:hypothetical protein
MINDYEAMVRALYSFILGNAPAGAARELARVRENLDAGNLRDWISLEFRPTEDTGANLYVRIESPEGKYGTTRLVDSEGNEWSAWRVRCEVSWASWGTADLDTCQRRVDVMNATIAFARQIEAAFPNVFHSLDATAVEVQLRNAARARERAKAQVTEFVKLHAKGMKVGQEKIVPVPEADFQPVCPLEVEREECGRRFKYRATATSREGFSFVRLA